MRDDHDRHRSATKITTPSRGDIVYIYSPTTTAQKLTMQWSPPCHLVLRSGHDTCLVRPLTSAAGRRGKFPQDATCNTSSIKIAALRPADFWIGARVLRKHKQAWFLGTVIEVSDDEGQTLFQVDYDDCGSEDIDQGELYDSIVYHPRLEQSLFQDTQLPALNQMIMFSLNRSPRFGKIVEINPLLPKPLSVMLWKPYSKAKSILTARFLPTDRLDSGADIIRISPAQIKLQVSFKPDGTLESKSRDKVRYTLTRSQRQPFAKASPKAQTTPPKAADPAKVVRATSPCSKPMSDKQSKSKSPFITHRYNTRQRARVSKT